MSGYPKSPPGIPNRSCLVVLVALGGILGTVTALGRAAWTALT